MSAIRPGGYRAGGYFVVRCSSEAPWMPREFGTTRAISASPELVPVFPDLTAPWNADTFADHFGLGPDARADAAGLLATVPAQSQLEWPMAFDQLGAASTFCEQIGGRRDDIVVIGIGLTEDDAGAFLEKAGRAGLAAHSMVKLLERCERLADTGQPLGYELLNLDLVSWAVCSLPALVRERLGISVNGDGLLSSLEEARVAAEFASRPDVPSEPGTWWPWLLVEYS